MTEKKKRGRPRKVESFQALKDIINEDVKTFPATDSEIKAEGTKKYRMENEKLIPPEGLGKIDVLKWLTAHKK